ncbi:hypothetical protein ABZ511_20195 [Nocardia gamkensis]|uniref:hypothetical protein n=1 Tax=Nocardia gamkensis TaxID=352869 RepID=UPI0033C2F642
MSGWSEVGAALVVGTAVVMVLLMVFFAASRWWRRPLRGPSVYHIAERVGHEQLCLLGWPPLGWPAVEPIDGPEFGPGDAHALMQVHLECDADECSWKCAAVETLRTTGRMRPSKYPRRPNPSRPHGSEALP